MISSSTSSHFLPSSLPLLLPSLLLLLLLPSAFAETLNSPPPPSTPALTSEAGYEIREVERSLRSYGTQSTTATLLFNTTNVGAAMAELPGATFLAPKNSAWSSLGSQEGGPQLELLLAGAMGNVVLINLLKYHIVTEYLLYVDLQLTDKGAGLPTLLNQSVYISPYDGQNFFYTNSSEPEKNSTSDEPDIHQDGVISVQGISEVLIPDLSLLWFSDFEDEGGGPGAAPSPSPTFPVFIPQSVGEQSPPSPQSLDSLNMMSGAVPLAPSFTKFDIFFVPLLFAMFQLFVGI